MGGKTSLLANFDKSVIFQSIAPDNLVLAVEINTSYLVLGDPSTIILPDARTATGGRFQITFLTGNHLITVMDPLANGIVNLSGQQAVEMIPVGPGTYEFRSIPVALNNTGIWVVVSSSGAQARRNIDVAYCHHGELPPFDASPSGPAGRVLLTAAAGGSTMPVCDSANGYQPGQMILVPYDTSGAAGVYLVRVMNSDSDWQLEMMPPDENAAVSGTEYHVLAGDVYAGRVFTRYDSFTFVLDRLPCASWPPQNPLNGSTNKVTMDSQRTNQEVLFGHINLLATASGGGTMDMTLVAPLDPTVLVGQRFAIKVVDAPADYVATTINLTAPGSQQIEALDHTTGSPVAIAATLGMYLEWVLGPDGVWRLLA